MKVSFILTLVFTATSSAAPISARRTGNKAIIGNRDHVHSILKRGGDMFMAHLWKTQPTESDLKKYTGTDSERYDKYLNEKFKKFIAEWNDVEDINAMIGANKAKADLREVTQGVVEKEGRRILRIHNDK